VIGSLIAIFQFAFVTLIAAFAAGVVITVVAQLYGSFLRYQARETDLRDRIARYSRLVTGLQDRVESRKAEAAGAATHLFGAQRLEKQLKTKLRDLEKQPHRFVRMIGQEMMPNRPFEALAMNSSVAHQVKRGERHAFYDSSWARPVPVHIWAKSQEEAQAEFERVFPRSTGFKMLDIQALSVNGPGGPVADAAAAARAAEEGTMDLAAMMEVATGGGSAKGKAGLVPPTRRTSMEMPA
jgi:hypothetical protein